MRQLEGTTLGTHNGATYNQVINGHFYYYQEMWCNQGMGAYSDTRCRARADRDVHRHPGRGWR